MKLYWNAVFGHWLEIYLQQIIKRIVSKYSLNLGKMFSKRCLVYVWDSGKKNKNSDHVPSFRRMSSMLLNNLIAIVDTLHAKIKFSKHFYGPHFEHWPKIKIGLRTKLPWAYVKHEQHSLNILIQSFIRKESD